MPIILQITLGILILVVVFGVWVWRTMQLENRLNRRLTGEERWDNLYPLFEALCPAAQQDVIQYLNDLMPYLKKASSSSISDTPPDNAFSTSGPIQKKPKPLIIFTKEDVKVWNCQKSES